MTPLLGAGVDGGPPRLALFALLWGHLAQSQPASRDRVLHLLLSLGLPGRGDLAL